MISRLHILSRAVISVLVSKVSNNVVPAEDTVVPVQNASEEVKHNKHCTCMGQDRHNLRGKSTKR